METNNINILIFRTNIRTKQMAEVLSPVFNNHPVINRWCVDTDDIDNVLKVVTNAELSENDIIRLTRSKGFDCEALD